MAKSNIQYIRTEKQSKKPINDPICPSVMISDYLRFDQKSPMATRKSKFSKIFNYKTTTHRVEEGTL